MVMNIRDGMRVKRVWPSHCSDEHGWCERVGEISTSNGEAAQILQWEFDMLRFKSIISMTWKYIGSVALAHNNAVFGLLASGILCTRNILVFFFVSSVFLRPTGHRNMQNHVISVFLKTFRLGFRTPLTYTWLDIPSHSVLCGSQKEVN